MSSVTRGRGYTGKHHSREETRPGRVQGQTMDKTGTMDAKPTNSTPVMDDHQKEPPACVQNFDLNDDPEIKELLHIDEAYAPLLLLLEQFTPGEDGIQFNRKLKNFESRISAMCPDQNKLIEAFSSFHAAALQNTSTARKLATVGTSFTRQQKRQILRNTLLIVMQTCFSKLDVLERSNPQYLINATNLIGDYFAEGRLINGDKIVVLAAPIVQYLKALLQCNDLKAHKTLTAQLMQNGRDLFSLRNNEIEELSISIRVRLLDPPSASTIWLLLCADLCLNKFLPLPQNLQEFYAEKLNLVEDNLSYNEVDFGSWKKEPDPVESVNQHLSQATVYDDETKPKLRPILGAGAGLLRQEQNEEVEYKNKSLSKRYDLNSWRQNGVETKDDIESYAQGDGVNIQAPCFIPKEGESSKGVENWRKEGDAKALKKFVQQESKESLLQDDDEKRVSRNRKKSEIEKRRHVSDVPRSHKYWDHDDRCDIDYSS